MSIQGTRGLHLHRQVCLRPATAFRNRVLLVPGLPPGREELRAEREEWRGSAWVLPEITSAPWRSGRAAAAQEGAGSARARPLEVGRTTHIPALVPATRDPRVSPVAHLATRSVLLPRARLLLSPPVSASRLHPRRIHCYPNASESERWCTGLQTEPSSGPRLGIGGHGQQHGHQALLRQPLR